VRNVAGIRQPVDVAVLPLIRVDDWTPENRADKVEGVRRSFSDTLRIGRRTTNE
jgi:hypothetical protein